MIAAVPSADRIAKNIEAEFALLAGLLFEARTIDTVADYLSPEDFAEPFYGRVYSVIVAEHARGRPVSVLTIKPLVEADPYFDGQPPNAFLATLAASVSTLQPRAAAQHIKDLARRRRLIDGLRGTLDIAGDSNEPLEAAVDAADAAIMEAVERTQAVAQPSAADAIGELIAAADEPKRSVQCRIVPSMDNLLGGMRPKQLVIGAGRPGMGKTAAALSYALGAAQNGHGVLYVTLEMSAKELSARMTADLSFDGRGGVPYAAINSDTPGREAVRAMVSAKEMLDGLPFHLIDAGTLTLGRLDMLVRRFKRRYAAKGESLDLVVVDYLQLLRCDDKRTSIYETVSEISRRLKAIAKDHDVAVFALAQLSREVEKRSDKKPQLSDLRDSGQIEQDADAVLFLYRHEYYLRQAEPAQGSAERIQWEETLAGCEGIIEFICAKRRNGPNGNAEGVFHAKYQAVRG